MSRLLMMSRVFAGVVLLLVSSPGRAADLDQDAPPPRRHAAARPYVLDPRCRVVPQPELNLYGDTARFRPTIICMSRGVFADSFAPYPFYFALLPTLIQGAGVDLACLASIQLLSRHCEE